jgi:hypothetical protein
MRNVVSFFVLVLVPITSLSEPPININGTPYFLVDQKTFISHHYTNDGGEVEMVERVISRFIFDSHKENVVKPLAALYFTRRIWDDQRLRDSAGVLDSVRRGVRVVDLDGCTADNRVCMYIPIVSSVPYTIGPDDSLESVAESFAVEPESIVALNPELSIPQEQTITTIYIPMF